MAGIREEFLRIRKLEEGKFDAFNRFALEAIALENDNELMRELMLEMLQRNTKLNDQLRHQLKEIERLSVTDQLTGLYNRRKLIDALDDEYNRMKRYDKTFSIIMFDIDHFKKVNDNYGHDVGDYVLREISELVMGNFRVTDVIARWGGEEFMILLPETRLVDASNKSEKIRALIENYPFKHVEKITCSFGSIESHKDIPVDAMLKHLDEALYKAKETGRNKIILHEYTS